MFFGAGVPSWHLGEIFATHPPLSERVRRIDPSFNGRFEVVPTDFVAVWGPERVPDQVRAFAASAETARAGRLGPSPSGAAAAGVGLPSAGAAEELTEDGGEALLERLGRPGPEHLAHAHALLAGVPSAVMEAARDLEGARALALALFASHDVHVREAQYQRVGAGEGEGAPARVEALRLELERADPGARVLLIDVLTGTLTQLDPARYASFRQLVQDLVQADARIDVVEWVQTGLLLRRLDLHFRRRKPSRPRFSRLSGLERELTFVLSALAHAAHGRTDVPEQASSDALGEDRTTAGQAFARAASVLRLPALALWPDPEAAPRALEAALATLAELAPQQKKRVLAACAASVAGDQKVTAEEAELFRVIADWMECPAPPLLPGQRLA